jgi:hypothetical protein
MKTVTRFNLLAATAGVAMMALAPLAANADSTQKNKNLWRNIAIGSGVVAAHGLIKHNGTEALIGAAGAAYSANRYEQDRHHQSQAAAARRARYHRLHRYHHHYRHH